MDNAIVPTNRESITNVPIEELRQTLKQLSQPQFRLTQLLQWLYQKRVDSFRSMSNLGAALQEKLQELFTLQRLSQRYCLESKDGDAVKFGFSANQSDDIFESVLLFDGNRRTLCVSSQVGCPLGCAFCATATLGFKRNLSQSEILGQVIAAYDYLQSRCFDLNTDTTGSSDTTLPDEPISSRARISNVVFMGMGEALLNFDAVFSAIEILMQSECFAIGGRRITLSTAGIIPGIEKMLQVGLNIGLAISLNGPDNVVRSSLMPINKTYPIQSLINIAHRFFEQQSDKVTFEYVMIKGVTDTPVCAKTLVRLLQKVPCKINLIGLNPTQERKFEPSSKQQIAFFSQELSDHGLTVMVRKSLGQDIFGACGQLSAHAQKWSTLAEQKPKI
ncbi:MAG: 23S rRNA (adenine(2503)-C(2))-methyltransferase RlmN [Chitinivibrionales bacterium]|nr:23S rRNA (adenine(2503)-C(2))-methyltransferase RlmN [Chitinivibrionales bacterium]